MARHWQSSHPWHLVMTLITLQCSRGIRKSIRLSEQHNIDTEKPESITENRRHWTYFNIMERVTRALNSLFRQG